MTKFKVLMENCRYKTKDCQPTLGSYATHLVCLGGFPPIPRPFRPITAGTFRTFSSPIIRRIIEETRGLLPWLFAENVTFIGFKSWRKI